MHDRLNVNGMNACVPFPPCDSCGLLTMSLWIALLEVLLPNPLVTKLYMSITSNPDRTMTHIQTPTIPIGRTITTCPIGMICKPMLGPYIPDSKDLTSLYKLHISPT